MPHACHFGSLLAIVVGLLIASPPGDAGQPTDSPVAAAGGGTQEQQASNRPLLLLSPRPGLDYRRLNEQVAIRDHYYEVVEGQLSHHLMATPRQDDLARLKDLPVAIRSLDPVPRGESYLWVSARNLTPDRLRNTGARLIATRSGGATALVAVSGGRDATQKIVDWVREVSPEAVRVSVVDLTREIPPGWIDPATLERSGARLSALRRGAAYPAVKALVDGVDADGCRLLIRQLTGAATIRVGDDDFTVRSRFATHADMPVLVKWLADELGGAGLDAEVDEFTSPAHPSHGVLGQVVATIPGTDLADELILVTAHLDAVRNTPGADDNASGIVALAAAARQLAKARGQFRRTIRFVAFNDEEQGLIGSTDYARRLRDSGAIVVGVLNMDMLGYDGDGDQRIQLQSNGTPAADGLSDRLVAAAETYELDLKLVRIVDAEESSDYAAFWRVGYPAINLGDEYFLCDDDCVSPPRRGVAPPEGDFTPCYHQPCDRLDDPAFHDELIVESAKLVVAGVAELAELRP